MYGNNLNVYNCAYAFSSSTWIFMRNAKGSSSGPIRLELCCICSSNLWLKKQLFTPSKKQEHNLASSHVAQFEHTAAWSVRQDVEGCWELHMSVEWEWACVSCICMYCTVGECVCWREPTWVCGEWICIRVYLLYLSDSIKWADRGSEVIYFSNLSFNCPCSYGWEGLTSMHVFNIYKRVILRCTWQLSIWPLKH